MEPQEVRDILQRAIDGLSKILLGKEREIRLSLSTFFAGGHLLLEDVPGVGKTTLAKGLAHVLGLEFKRIQLTNETLPADIIGTSIYREDVKEFVFVKGPIFTQILLADEINRTSPRTQSALLEAMEEAQVTQDGVTYALPSPFFVVATQNPIEQAGTQPLPDSQLDRFAMCITLGYPAPEWERRLYRQERGKNVVKVAPVLEAKGCLEIRELMKGVEVSDKILDYLLGIVEFSRDSGRFYMGLSPRAGQWLLRCARVWAFLEGRDFVLPEDIQAVLPWVVNHRLRLSDTFRRLDPDEALEHFKEIVL